MPLRHDLAPGQVPLPGILGEEDPLDVEVMDPAWGGPSFFVRRARQAHAAIRALCVDRPPDVTEDEWRVCLATLAPPAAHLRRVPGTSAGTLSALSRARECFPGLSITTALRRFREAQRSPRVAALLSELRALEVAEVLETRGPVRERLHHLLTLADHIDPALAVQADEVGAGEAQRKAAMVAVTAAKLLIDMDGLKIPEADLLAATGAGRPDEDADDAQPSLLAEKVGRVAADLRARAKVPA